MPNSIIAPVTKRSMLRETERVKKIVARAGADSSTPSDVSVTPADKDEMRFAINGLRGQAAHFRALAEGAATKAAAELLMAKSRESEVMVTNLENKLRETTLARH